MNSAGGRCHDNARCESMWARMKEELLYGRYNTEKLTIEELKTIIWRYFMSYWNNRRICTANGGLPPMENDAGMNFRPRELPDIDGTVCVAI